MAWDPSADPIAQRGFATCDRVLELVGDRADALVTCGQGTNALTRFANSRIHQNMASDDDQVRLRVVVDDGRIAQATTTRLDPDGLERLVEATVSAARLCPPDPQYPGRSFVPKTFSTQLGMQAQAELGFFVVQIDGLGTSNRSKAFHDVAWKNLGHAGFPDRILRHKAVAAKYPWYDASRVGIYGTSAGGQNAMGGVLYHPEFYKAAAASSSPGRISSRSRTTLSSGPGRWAQTKR